METNVRINWILYAYGHNPLFFPFPWLSILSRKAISENFLLEKRSTRVQIKCKERLNEKP